MLVLALLLAEDTAKFQRLFSVLNKDKGIENTGLV